MEALLTSSVQGIIGHLDRLVFQQLQSCLKGTRSSFQKRQYPVQRMSKLDKLSGREPLSRGKRNEIQIFTFSNKIFKKEKSQNKAQVLDFPVHPEQPYTAISGFFSGTAVGGKLN